MQLCGVLPPGSGHPEAPPTTRRGGAHDCEYSYAPFVCIVSKFHHSPYWSMWCPCVVQVQEWMVRQTESSGNTIIGVKEHKTTTQQVATFVLSQEEECVSWSDFLWGSVRTCSRAEINLYSYVPSTNSGLICTSQECGLNSLTSPGSGTTLMMMRRNISSSPPRGGRSTTPPMTWTGCTQSKLTIMIHFPSKMYFCKQLSQLSGAMC